MTGGDQFPPPQHPPAPRFWSLHTAAELAFIAAVILTAIFI